LEAHKLELHISEQHLIKLDGLGSAGYVWSVRIDGDKSALSIIKRPISRNSSLHPPDSVSLPEEFTLIGLAAGRVVATFVQKRPWEGDMPSRAEVVYYILVKGSKGRPGT
jgi:hypothetical protein